MYFKEKILKVVKLLQEDFKQYIKEKKMKLKFEIDFKKTKKTSGQLQSETVLKMSKTCKIN